MPVASHAMMNDMHLSDDTSVYDNVTTQPLR